jgi:hypothetical protein
LVADTILTSTETGFVNGNGISQFENTFFYALLMNASAGIQDIFFRET